MSARTILIVALVACGTREPPVATSDVSPNVTGSLDTTIPNGNELSIYSAAGVREPLRRAVEITLKAAMTKARSCMEGIYGSVFAEVDFDVTGKVSRAHIRSPLLEDTPLAKCMEKELATMAIGKTDAAVNVAYPIRNLPSAEQLNEAGKIIKQAL